VEDLRAFEALEEGRALGEEKLLKKAEVIRELEECTLRALAAVTQQFSLNLGNKITFCFPIKNTSQ
jgi:hypothetical protein